MTLIDVNRDMIRSTRSGCPHPVSAASSRKRSLPGTPEGLQEHINGFVDLRSPSGEAAWDLIDVLANPLPGLAIARFGWGSTSDQAKFTHWANEYGEWLERQPDECPKPR
ncbi:MAG: hypothetical protein R2849_00950 [Thermomicrobiales bacterium]